MKDLFVIENLVCSYDGKNEVLRVENLSIPKGKVVVLLGASGAGKSTILETLGLMNNTIKNGSRVIFNPGDEDKVFEFSELWQVKDEKRIAEIRRKYFSFIFQNTNLMPNFTAYENIGLTKMIEGVSEKEANKATEEMANRLQLFIDKDKKAYEMSGGEKQRAAFIRAIIPDFTVLFGDEPTGNLDPKNANVLLTLLRKEILDKNKTAIIVSHNINLAIEYSDMIIVLKKTRDNYSVIDNKNIFIRISDNGSVNWQNKYDKSDVTKEMHSLIENIIE